MKHKPTITTVEQLRELDPAPCDEALELLAENGITELADAWDRCHRGDWLLWIDSVLDLLSDRERRLIACRCVRETPLGDGRKVWDLLTDESRRAVAISERYADGDATYKELAAAADTAASASARAAAARAVAAARVAAAAAARAYASYAAARAADTAAAAARAYASYAAARAADTAAAAARAYALDAARAAQADIVREIAGNPFR